MHVYVYLLCRVELYEKERLYLQWDSVCVCVCVCVCAEHCDWPLEIRETVEKMKIEVEKKKESLEKTWN